MGVIGSCVWLGRSGLMLGPFFFSETLFDFDFDIGRGSRCRWGSWISICAVRRRWVWVGVDMFPGHVRLQIRSSSWRASSLIDHHAASVEARGRASRIAMLVFMLSPFSGVGTLQPCPGAGRQHVPDMTKAMTRSRTRPRRRCRRQRSPAAGQFASGSDLVRGQGATSPTCRGRSGVRSRRSSPGTFQAGNARCCRRRHD